MGKVRDEEENKARRNIMWMQMFNYDRTNRDSAQRPIEMSAAVAGGSKSITNKKGMIIGIVGAIMAVVLLCAFSYLWNKNRDIGYTNLFEYAVNCDWESEEEFYLPAQVTFGMSKEEVLQSQELSNVTVRNEEKQQIISETQKITNLLETIEEAIFNKMFVVVGEVGLVEVIYQLIIDDADLEEMSMMLYDQASKHMTTPSVPLENLKKQQMVEWIQTEKIEETKQMPRSIVRVYFELEPYEDETKTVISLSIFTNRALRDSLLDKLDE
jgi:hypothetical protein